VAQASMNLTTAAQVFDLCGYDVEAVYPTRPSLLATTRGAFSTGGAFSGQTADTIECELSIDSCGFLLTVLYGKAWYPTLRDPLRTWVDSEPHMQELEVHTAQELLALCAWLKTAL